MKKIVEYAPSLAIITVTIGILGYGIAVGIAAFSSREEGSIGLHQWGRISDPNQPL